MFIEPGTVIRGDESERDDSQSVIFSCVPYFDIQVPPKTTLGKTDRLHPPRSLMQSYYPYEPLRERDMEQAFNKFGNGPTNSIIHVPLLWMMNIGSHAVVTCGHKPLSSEFVKSITVVEEDVKAFSISQNGKSRDTKRSDITSIRLTDWTGRVLIYSLDECRTYFEMEQRLRELRSTAWRQRSESLKLLWNKEKGDEKVTPGKWLDIIQNQNAIFIDLSTLDEEKEKELDLKWKEGKPESSLGAVVSKSAIPPFFFWSHISMKEDGKPDFKSPPANMSTNIASNAKEQTRQQFDFIPPEVRHSMECLERVEKAVMSETMSEYDAIHIVERSFTSTKYYSSIPEETMVQLQDRFTSLLQNVANLGKGPSTRTRHQTIVDDQCAKITSSAAELTDLVNSILKLFVWDVDKSTMLRKVWGAMANVAKITGQVQQRRPSSERDAAEYTDPEWRSPEFGDRKWFIRTCHNTFQKGKYTPLPGNDALNQTIKACRRCRRNRAYDDPNGALEHLRVHLAGPAISGKWANPGPHNTSEKEADSELQGWIRNSGQILVEEVNAGFLAIFEQANDEARTLLRETRELAQGVTDTDGKMSDIYSFPPELHKTLQRVVQFFFAVERAVYYTEEVYENKLTNFDDMEYMLPFSTEGLQVLGRFCDGVKTSIAAARKDLCLMAHSKGTFDYLKRLSLGPEYLCSWLMRRLLVKPVDNSMAVADLYYEYLSTLQFTVNHRPSKRLLRSIKLLQEELSALSSINAWQTKLIESYAAVLNPTSYPNDIPSRGAMFPHERLVLQSCLESLLDAKADFSEMIEKCGPLSESTKQSAEINEEDHGKAILVFTVVTIIFLPLSFVTSYLGMNTSDIRDMTSKQSLFWEIAIPLTAVTMGSILLIAYNGDEIRDNIASYARLFTGKQDTRTSARGITVAQRKN
ncbi:uncharacterized protein BDR25DRAFT_79625, partial [Lindgomyces ingoldianus]